VAPAGATFEDLPKAGSNAKSYTAWQKSFASWLASSQKLELMRHAGLKLTSAAGESGRSTLVVAPPQPYVPGRR